MGGCFSKFRQKVCVMWPMKQNLYFKFATNIFYALSVLYWNLMD